MQRQSFIDTPARPDPAAAAGSAALMKKPGSAGLFHLTTILKRCAFSSE